MTLLRGILLAGTFFAALAAGAVFGLRSAPAAQEVSQQESQEQPRSSDQGPAQPIAFSHAIHAGENAISCQYCHSGVERSTAAGVPAVQTCYECHRLVRLRNDEVRKVFDHWERREPIRWMRVYSLPEHVYFSHKRHTLAGVDCQSCHGDVRQAEVITRQAPLTMGWCVDCHEQRSAPLACDTCHK